ncbi:hypothetical protein BDV96DRAFT_642437 [Lophiotrema nucula]|uniref:Uncharacterized protein n=1 Tax=Lophiotrema nucula TaxID=690887 RepID=A0A6A5ZIR2_9PLEO|nr:hypothetical protein BDV96DRAFT_642437 [Lophiotrema nucula]
MNVRVPRKPPRPQRYSTESAPTTDRKHQESLHDLKSTTSLAAGHKCTGDSKLKRWWREIYQYCSNIRARKKSKRSKKSRRIGTREDEEFARTIHVVFQNDDGVEILRHARALLDTGNPKNLISPSFIARFSLSLPNNEGSPILETPGDGLYISTGSVEGRFACPGADPKFFDAKFEISKVEERFDVVIGSEDINEYNLVNVNPILGLAITGFRAKLKKPSKADTDRAKELQRRKREQNEARKRALEANAVGRSLFFGV